MFHTLLGKIQDAVFYDGYQKALRTAELEIVKRYARGNVATQLGDFDSEEDLDRRRADADIAMKHLEKRFGRRT